MKCVNEGFVERPWKLQILFRHQPLHVRLEKRLKRRPKPVAFESRITEKRGLKVIEFLFLFLLFLFFISTTEKMERYNFLLLCG
jgi:hypothetical protein